MPYYIVSFQDQNWEDDGGAHDPVLVELSEDDWRKLMDISVLPKDSEFYTQIEESYVGPSVLPVLVSGYGTVWTSW